MLEVIGPEPRRKVLPNCRRWKLSCVLWLEMVRKGSSERNHSHKEVPFGILLQFMLDSQPAKMSRSIWEMKERSSVTLGFWKLVAGKPSMLQNPIRMWPSALRRGRGSPKVESEGKIDTELLFKLLLLLCSWSSTGVGWEGCRTGPVRGTVGGGKGAVPQIGSWDCRYVVPLRKSVLGWGG